MCEYKLIVAGGRNFNDYDKLKSHLDDIVNLLLAGSKVTIISGGARGADKLGERYARENGLAVEVYPADWDKYGKSAGPRRNEQMAEVANGLVAFWDGKSRGTKNMIDNIKKRKKMCVTIELTIER